MQIEQVHYRFKAHATYGFGVLARFVVVLFSPTMLLAFSATTRAQQAAIGRTAIRSFRIHVPQHALDDLRRRIANTRWPDRETVSDSSQGVQLATIQNLAQCFQIAASGECHDVQSLTWQFA